MTFTFVFDAEVGNAVVLHRTSDHGRLIGWGDRVGKALEQRDGYGDVISRAQRRPLAPHV